MIVARVGQLYRHVNTGGLYKVLMTSFNTETCEINVVYKAMDQRKRIFHQPQTRFQDGRFEKVDFTRVQQEKMPSVLQMLTEP